MRSDSKVRELMAVKVLHTSLLNITVVTFKVFSLRSYASMPVPSTPFKTMFSSILLVAGRPDLSSSVTLSLPSEKHVTHL
jgi:hypothetical protein